jgi:HAD superfamily hydrolase (TIGR01450 family)
LAQGVLAAGHGPGNVILDLDGCLYVGGSTVPGARAAIETLESGSWRIVAATNNSTRHTSTVAARIERITGIVVSPDRIVTSAQASVRLIGPHDAPVLVVGEDGLRQTLSEAGIAQTDDPDAAASVLVGLDRDIHYDTIRRAMAAILHGARFLATNGDATFPTADVPVPGAGAIVAAIERASGVAPVYAGKPHEPMRLAIDSALEPGPTWMVGDRLDTDIAMGRAAGWGTILVMTGVTRPEDDIPAHLTPDHVIESVADLPGLLA